MIRSNLKTMLVAATLSVSLGAAAYAQSFIFRTEVTGSTGDPSVLITLVSGSGLAMELNAANAEPGVDLPGETRTLTYRNEVSRDVEVTSVSVSPNQDNFIILSDGCTGPLLIGAQCSIQVQFQASEDGSYTGALNVEAS